MKILLTLFILFIFPIPLKFYIFYDNDNYYIKIYNFTLLNNGLSKKKKEKIKTEQNTPPNKNESKKKHIFKKQKSFNISELLNFSTVKNFIHKFRNLKFKPILIFHCETSYSFADAARTAIAYGSLCTLPSIIHFFIDIIFNVKKYDFNITPVFEDEFIVKVKGRSIIFISLANIIYMIFIFLILIYSEIHKNKKYKNMKLKKQ